MHNTRAQHIFQHDHFRYWVRAKNSQNKNTLSDFILPLQMHVQNHERVQNFCFYPFRKKLKENPGSHGMVATRKRLTASICDYLFMELRPLLQCTAHQVSSTTSKLNSYLNAKCSFIAFSQAHFHFWGHERLSDRLISKRYPKSDAAPWVVFYTMIQDSISVIWKCPARVFKRWAVVWSLNGNATAHCWALKKH